MFTLTVENKRGQQLQLTNSKTMKIVRVDGLTPSNATVNLSNLVSDDGSLYNSSKVNERNMVIYVRLLSDVENQRQLLYRYFQTKQWCKIYYKNNNRNVYIEGYVEAIEGDFFTQSQEIQISIVCPKPYFKGLHDIHFDMSSTLAMFEFPFSIDEEGIEFSKIEQTVVATVNNTGDVECGVKIEFMATGTVRNPMIWSVGDYNKYFKINIEMQSGDKININTNKGEKSVTLTRHGITTDIMNLIDRYSDWFILDVGENQFTYECEYGNEDFYCTFLLSELFGGV
jgi:hypothetical protein